MNSYPDETDLYEGVYYCQRCGTGLHIIRIAGGDRCPECGGTGFISLRDFDVLSIIERKEE